MKSHCREFLAPYLAYIILTVYSNVRIHSLYSAWGALTIFFKYNCQPRGNISEAERTIGNQSEQASTLHMITNQINSATTYNDLEATDSEWAQELFILHYRKIEGKS